MLCGRVKNVFKTHTPEFFENYELEIGNVIDKAYVFDFSELNIYGMLTLNQNIIIRTAPSCFNKKNEIGYYSVIILHELAHLASRYKCRTAKDFLDYENDENTFFTGYKKFKTLINERQILQRERIQMLGAGFQVELNVFGRRLSKLNTLAAKFLSKPSNWNRKDFKKALEKKNYKEVYFKKLKRFNFRRSCSESDDEAGWCSIGILRAALRKQIKHTDNSID